MNGLDEIRNDSGEKFQMGLDISEVGKGDVIMVKRHLEKILSISRNHYRNDSIIRTASGSYSITQIEAYGRRI